MKIALYIDDGVQQIVLTPETSTEKSILEVLRDPKIRVQIMSGQFYDCAGGWTRQGPANTSTILVMDKPEKPDPGGGARHRVG